MMPQYTFTRLLVSNFKDCFRFYRDVMGFTPGFGTEDDTYADFTLGAVNISLFDKAEMSAALGTSARPTQSAAQDSVCLVFGVEDLDAAYQQMVARGGNCVVGPTDHPDWGIRTAHFRDPDGNLIEINQSLAP
jgi:predicted enzyme related to lactoylglutathione lyase